MINTLSKFTNKYQLSKTLRFELKPIGKTLEYIEAKGLLTQDKQRAGDYQQVKKIIDEYHKDFIEKALGGLQLEKLEDYLRFYAKQEQDEDGKKFKDLKDKMRKQIAEKFTKHADYSKVSKEGEGVAALIEFVKDDADKKKLADKFNKWATYFTGFYENRKNMYSDKAQSTAIAYRLIHENLPKFLDNTKGFEKIKAIPELHEKCAVLYKEIEEYLNVLTIDEAFDLDYYNMVLTQKQIDVYNLIIGGRTPKENEKKIQGLNEYINLYNQKQKDKKDKIPKLKVLYKQILSDRESISFLQDKFENSQEVLNAINEYYHANLKSLPIEKEEETENVLKRVQELLANLNTNNLSQIYIRNGKAITDIAQALFSDYSIIKEALKFSFTNTLEIGKKGLSKKQEESIDKYVRQDYFSIAEIENALWSYRNENETLKDLKQDEHKIADYFKDCFKTIVKDKEYDLVSNVEAKYSCIKGILENYPKDKKLNQEQKDIDNIKNFLDSLMEILHFVKPLMLPNDSTLEKDADFYNTIQPYYEQLQHLIPLYNKVRNFATQKAYSIEKIKLNFENSTLLDGWDVNKEESNTSILFRKGNLYFLGIMDKSHNKIFRDIPKAKTENTYSKINYKLLPGASKMLPKVFFSNRNIAFYNPSEEILNIRNHGTHTKGGSPQEGFEKLDFNLSHCRRMIDFFKISIEKHPEWKSFGFSFSETNSYDSIDGFYREVEAQGYNITYTEIDEDYINQIVSQGKLYLFQIYNKDFSEYSKGRPNMHTMYWKALFDDENLKDVVYKLNGQAEVFYRKKSIEEDKRIIHKANKAINNKNPDANKKQSTFEYDLIKDKRFTLDKFQFHVPITLNFKSKGNDYINFDVLDYLKNNPNVNIIGLDRGERHLIYLTLINQKGEILKQFTLNDIINEHKGTTYKTSYKNLLEKKEEERAAARENWGIIENIKELKEGYISQVVHKIATMMVEYNAIVVMEDLNMGFKRGRFKVEKQVYQKLEKMLIDKLNYLVFKEKKVNEIGGLYKALQLTSKFESFQKMGKQSGFLFYVPAWNTSKIDPTTGFVNLFNTKYESIEKAQQFFEKFDSIHFNSKEKYFEFAFDYDNFTEKGKDTKTKWTVCTFGERILTFRNPEANNQWDNKEINLTEQFEDLLGKFNIAYGNGTDIRTQIVSQNSKELLKELLDLFRLTLQMRNSITNSEVDYLISPVKNSNGSFYDSRNGNDTLPKDADANGAYHIAKKGLMWLEQINEFEGENWKKLDFEKTNKAWLNFVQGNK